MTTFEKIHYRRAKRNSVDLVREQKRRGTFFRAFAYASTALAVVTACLSGPLMGLCVFAMSAYSVAAMEPGRAATALGLVPARTVNYVNGIQGVAASGTATLNIPVNRRYHSLRIRTTNAAGALTDPTTIVSNVQLIVNGVTMLNTTPLTLINKAKTFRITPGTGEIPVFFTQPWRNDTRTAEATSWDLFGQGTFVLKMTFLNPGGGVGIEAVQADFDFLRNVGRDGKAFLAILKCTDISFVMPNGVGDITTIPTNYPLQRIFMTVSANAISLVRVYGDGQVVVWEATKTQNQDLLNANLITGTFFEYPLIFDYDSKLGSNLKTKDLDVQVTSTGALTITAHVEQLVPGFV